MSVAPTVARARPHKKMRADGDPSPGGAAVRVEDIERALVLAREVANATAKGGAANLRIEHLRALFANGNGSVSPDRMQAALEAAGLRVEPPLSQRPDSVSLSVVRGRAALAPKGGNGAGARRAAAQPAPNGASAAAADPPARPSGVAAYQAAAGTPRRAPTAHAPPPADGVTLDDAQRQVAAEHDDQRTARSIAALMPALILPVLAASFLGPLFGAAFAGLALLASAMLSRPGALADGKLGPIRMPASLARSFLLVSFGVALGALATSLALVAAGGGDTEPSDPNAPLEQKQTPPSTTTAPPRTTTPPAPPASQRQHED